MSITYWYKCSKCGKSSTDKVCCGTSHIISESPGGMVFYDAKLPTTGGVKYDGDKPMMALLPARALEEVAAVLNFGAKKYAAHNWRKGIVYSRLLSAALRHIFAYLRGENNDPESGISHVAHSTCCLLFLLEFILEGRTSLDDRYEPEAT